MAAAGSRMTSAVAVPEPPPVHDAVQYEPRSPQWKR